MYVMMRSRFPVSWKAVRAIPHMTITAQVQARDELSATVQVCWSLKPHELSCWKKTWKYNFNVTSSLPSQGGQKQKRQVVSCAVLTERIDHDGASTAFLSLLTSEIRFRKRSKITKLERTKKNRTTPERRGTYHKINIDSSSMTHFRLKTTPSTCRPIKTSRPYL